MSLEELEILDAKSLPVGKLLTMIAKAQSIYLNHHLKNLGINATQLHLLFEISHQCDINQEKIAERCSINKGAVARSIKKLEEKGLVVRTIDENNRRQNKVSLTSEGKNILDESINLFDLWEEEVLKENYIEKEILQKSLKEIVINAIKLNQKGE